MKKMTTFLLLTLLIFAAPAEESDQKNPYAGVTMRSIGPALMSGRISDIDIHPENENIWYVAVGSGGVWKTTNAGTTWTPLFDEQNVYSIGSVTIDPNNPNRIWVGTGEDTGGRHTSYGDGIYLSEDGGHSWQHKGLKASERISTVIVHPNDSNIVWAAVHGPLWSKGGQRGLYKTTDGGETWNRYLGDDEWTGVSDVIIDPRNPDRLYASTWQRHRTVAAYMGGGPKTGIHKSEDGGETWSQLKQGLPKQNMGKIGLAISPQKPDELYAAIETERRTGGMYKSFDRGASWTKQSDAVAGGTGPHYYQELYASPHHYDRLYLMNNYMIISDDGGKNYRFMNEQNKHIDNHAIAFSKTDPDYVLVGTDGGLYESFDLTDSWKFVANLPVTQFYKLAVDDAEPFYHVYGGTQDNNTQGGPSRTDNVSGIRNSDWYVVLFGDGHQPATEPGNPDIMYAQWQQGNLVRVDKTTGEINYIQPQPDQGAEPERFNWDAPILVSPHDPQRLYFGSQRVWRSDDRGNSWQAISGDLTKNQERLELPIMGSTQSWDMPWDVLAMSNYNTITSISESPLVSGLIYIGTDDGLIQVTADGGKNWRETEVGDLPGVPETAFVNDIKADLHDQDTVYIALDNHKYGDFKPYLLKSENQGKSWKKINQGIPDNQLVWRIVQDHVDPQLMFLGTEFGLYVTQNGGQQWHPIKGGMPTIAVRDLAIQKRENDLVAATFGRGFYVFDDYSFLRNDSFNQDNGDQLFAVKDAWWYMPRRVLGGSPKASQGDAFYHAENPPFGAVFNYFLETGFETKKQLRQKAEKKALKEGEPVKFPGWDVVDAELTEQKAKIWLTVTNAEGEVVRRVQGTTQQGFNQVAWDLRYPALGVLRDGGGGGSNEPTGMMVVPGTYVVTLSQEEGGVVTQLDDPQSFAVKPLRKGALDGADYAEVEAFWQELASTQHELSEVRKRLSDAMEKVKKLDQALARSFADQGSLETDLFAIRNQLNQLDRQLNGNRAKQEIGEKTKVTIGARMGAAFMGSAMSTYGPTPNIRKTLDIAQNELKALKPELNKVLDDINAFEKTLSEIGAPIVD